MRPMYLKLPTLSLRYRCHNNLHHHQIKLTECKMNMANKVKNTWDDVILLMLQRVLGSAEVPFDRQLKSFMSFVVAAFKMHF